MFSSTQTELILATIIIAFTLIASRRAILYPAGINLLDIVLIFTGIYFGFGPWVAFIYGGGRFIYDMYLPPEPVSLLLKAYLVIGLYMLGLWCMRWFAVNSKKSKLLRSGSRDRFSLIELFRQYRMIKWQLVATIMGLIWFLRVIIGLRYGIWFSGTATMERVLGMPYYIVIFNQLSVIMAMGILVWGSTSFWTDRRLFIRFTAAAVLLSEFCWAFVKGRRWILIWFVFVFLGFLASKRKLKLKNVIVVLLVVVFAFQLVFPFFLGVRRFYSIMEGKSRNPIVRFAKAVVLAYENHDTALTGIHSENLRARPLFLRRFICRICEGLNKEPPMMGTVLLRTFESAIPHMIFPGKRAKLPAEQLIQEHFNYRLADTAASWPAVGCAEFGLPGGFIIGLFVGLFIICAERWSRAILIRHPFVALSFIGGLIVRLVNVEDVPTSSWVLCRNVLVMLVTAKFLTVFKLPHFNPTKQKCAKSEINNLVAERSN